MVVFDEASWSRILPDLPEVYLVAGSVDPSRRWQPVGVYQNLGGVEYGWTGLVPPGLATSDVVRVVEGLARPFLAPWEFPDRNPMPWFVLFPRLGRFTDLLRRRLTSSGDA